MRKIRTYKQSRGKECRLQNRESLRESVDLPRREYVARSTYEASILGHVSAARRIHGYQEFLRSGRTKETYDGTKRLPRNNDP